MVPRFLFINLKNNYMENQLRLAEGAPQAANINKALLDYYVPIETKTGVKLVREDVLDTLSNDDFEAYLDAIEGAGFTMGGKKRQARIERRQDRKDLVAAAKAKGIEAGTFQSTGTGIMSSLTNLAGTVLGGKLQGAGGAQEAAIDEAPKKSNVIYYIGGAVVLLGLVYLVAKPKNK